MVYHLSTVIVSLLAAIVASMVALRSLRREKIKARTSQQELKRQVEERTAELITVNARLREEMQEKDVAQNEVNRQGERLVRELTESSKKASVLRQMAELLQSCNDMPEAVSIVLGFAPKIFHQLRGALVLLNATKTHLEVVGSWADCVMENSVYEPNACWALRSARIHTVEAGDASAACAHAQGVKTAYFCIPILAQGEAIGVLHFQAKDNARGWFEHQLTLPGTFVEQVGLSVSNIRLREMLKSQSIKDPLTGLFNRRYLEEILERESRRAARANQPLGLIMIDFDHFKNFNDTFGHVAGDNALRELSFALQKSVRTEDIVCRYGGEEFIVLLPSATEQATLNRAEAIRSRVEALSMADQAGTLGNITISAGVATFPKNGSLPAELLAAADAAMYQAKESGRNRVKVAGERLRPGQTTSQRLAVETEPTEIGIKIGSEL